MNEPRPGQVVILNGAPRSGKSSIVAAIQRTFEGPWMNLGVDLTLAATPKRYRPGIGLRPGGERPDVEPFVVAGFAALYDSIAAHSRNGLNVVADVGHHDAYSRPLGILPACAQRLLGLPVLVVGVRCPLDVILERRSATGYVARGEGGGIPEPVQRWQEAVHEPGVYDLEVDTSRLSPDECADAIGDRLERGSPRRAIGRLAGAA